jgi:uncharacterized membrane protein
MCMFAVMQTHARQRRECAHKRMEVSQVMTPRVFGLVAAATIVLMVLIGVSGKNIASHTAQQNTETSSSQN